MVICLPPSCVIGEPRIGNKSLAHRPISFQHMFVWCLFSNPNLTTTFKYRCPMRISDQIRQFILVRVGSSTLNYPINAGGNQCENTSNKPP